MPTSKVPKGATKTTTALAILAAAFFVTAHAQCGRQADNKTCPGCDCCSLWGWCGSSSEHCGRGCQSQCNGCPTTPTRGGEGVEFIVPEFLFEEMLPHRNEESCPAHGFYTYDAFINASDAFPGFGTTGDILTRSLEIAAFFGQTSYQTSVQGDTTHTWGYCLKEETDPPDDYCEPSEEWPCAPGKKYYGRGPMQISYNYNYGPAGKAIGVDLLNNPELVAADPVISFKTAVWFWMTQQPPKPSCHDVITGWWVPTMSDNMSNRSPGYGVITNIINGELECGHGPDFRGASRIAFYWRYCVLLHVHPGDHLDCYTQRPFLFGNGLSAQ